MLKSIALGVAVVAGAAVAPLWAQPAPTEDPTIVVNGHIASEPKTVGGQARAVTLPPSGGGPLPRQYQALCVKVFGLPQGIASAIERRISDNARAFHVPVAGPRCSANAWVGTFHGGPAAAERLRTAQPWLFEGLTNFEVKRIFAQSRAAFAWHRTEERNSDGTVIPMAMVDLGDGIEVPVKVNQQYRVGRLVSPVRIDLSTSIVLIDANRALGKSIGQIADYATMRLLASVTDAAPADAAPLSTILTLFTEDGAPRELTAFDRAYLTGLYKLNPGASVAAIGDASAGAYRRQQARSDDRPSPN